MKAARRSLKSRFVFLLTSLIVIVMALDAVVLIDRERSLRFAHLRDQGIRLSGTLATLLAMSEADEWLRLKPVCQQIFADAGVAGVRLQLPAARIFLDLGEMPVLPSGLGANSVPDREMGVEFLAAGTDSALLRRSILTSAGQEGQVLVHLSLAPIREHVREIIVQTLILMAITLSFGFFMSSFLAGFILGPLQQFLEGVKRVAHGDYSRRLRVSMDDELAALAESFNGMIERLKERDELEERLHHRDKLATIGQLAAGVAHEVRNPLVAIRSLAEILAEDLQGETARRHMDVIIREVDRINGVTERLLRYSRPGEKRLEDVDPREVVEDLILLLRPQASRRGVRISLVDTGRGRIRVCRDELAQVLLNLLLNGINAVTGRAGIVELRIEAQGEELRISVVDNGRGMDIREREKLFVPYATGCGGTGLGLSIVRTLVQENGGRIEVETELGQGSTFHLHFPLAGDEGKLDPGGAT